MTGHRAANQLFCAALSIFGGLFLLLDHAQGQDDGNVVETPRMNVVFLDDGATRLTAANPVRRNDWDEWEKRVPTFLGLLNKFVADFQRASADQARPTDSQFALEVADSLSPERKVQAIAGELERIFNATNRPSSILARSTAGDDQLRLVFQDEKDYRPMHAAKFLRNLADISPLLAHSGIAEHFGPFQPPPTIAQAT